MTKVQCFEMLHNNANMNAYGKRTCKAKNVYLISGQLYFVTMDPIDLESITANLHALAPAPGGAYNSHHIPDTTFRPNLKKFSSKKEVANWIKSMVPSGEIPLSKVTHFMINRNGPAYHNLQHRIHDFYIPIFSILRFHNMSEIANEVQVMGTDRNFVNDGLDQWIGVSAKRQNAIQYYPTPIIFETFLYGSPELASHTPTTQYSVPLHDQRSLWNYRNFYLKNINLNNGWSLGITDGLSYDSPSRNPKLVITFLQKRAQPAYYNRVFPFIKSNFPKVKLQIIEWENGYSWKQELEIFLETDILISIDGTIVDSAYFLRPGSVIISLGRPQDGVRCQFAEQILSSIDFVKIIHFEEFTDVNSLTFDPFRMYLKVKESIESHQNFTIPRPHMDNLHASTQFISKIMTNDVTILKAFLYFNGMQAAMCQKSLPHPAQFSQIEQGLARINATYAQLLKTIKCKYR
jgi:hypothetical protein